MLPKTNLSHKDYALVAAKLTLIEFDWFAIDKLGQVAVFSSVTSGYIPEKVFSSYETFAGLTSLLNALPRFANVQIVTKELGGMDLWLEWSQRGLYAYDYIDVHRTMKFDRYDLIAVPEQPLLKKVIAQIEQFKEVIPTFNLIFSSDIQFSQLIK